MSKVISAEELTAFERWELPQVGAGAARAGADAAVDTNPNLLTAAQIEELQKQAYQEGFEQGRKDGLAAGQNEVHGQVQRLAQIMSALCEPFERLDEEVEQQLLSLAVVVARQLIRRELRADPGQVVAVVREAMAALPVAARNVAIYLHPEDAALVREALSLTDAGERPWRVIDDAVLARGGCRVQADDSFIDASVEKRLTSIVARLLGGERGDDVPAT